MGKLSFLHIWHDNSGEDTWASWYLKYVVVNDLQTMEKYYFICNKWLAVEKDDGLIERMIPVATEIQKKEFAYLLRKEGVKSIFDGHLWLSVFLKPAYSAFSRVERITCCFVSIFMSMLIYIYYYQLNNEITKDGLNLGPFYLSAKQVVHL